MRFFSKIVFIGNICFIISAVLRIAELNYRKAGNTDNVIPFPALEGSVVVFGLFAILLNAAFVFIILFRKSIRRPVPVSRFIIWFNLLMLPVQVWYHFFSKW